MDVRELQVIGETDNDGGVTQRPHAGVLMLVPGEHTQGLEFASPWVAEVAQDALAAADQNDEHRLLVPALAPFRDRVDFLAKARTLWTAYRENAATRGIELPEDTRSVADRHPGVQNIMQWLEPNLNLPTPQREIAETIHDVAEAMLDRCPDGPELTEGLRKLLEAKDCLVRASMGRRP